MQLVYEATNKPVQIGDIAETFRGESVVVLGITEPHKPASTGRVYVKFTDSDGSGSEFFPGVIGAKWIGRTDR